jgi:hypothetical protein
MESVSKIAKSIRAMIKVDPSDASPTFPITIFAISALYIVYRGQLATLGLSVGVALLMFALLPKQMDVALIAGALAGLLATHYSRSREGFASNDDDEEKEPFEEEEKETENFEEESRPRYAKKRNPAPDHGSRAEFLTLGKKYKLPNESDDKDFHLDAGTTFMNAYKALKPDQIAAMTKDTQDLMQTQKQLMSTLQTLKPLIQDGKEMMNMFQGYFGSGNPTA